MCLGFILLQRIQSGAHRHVTGRIFGKEFYTPMGLERTGVSSSALLEEGKILYLHQQTLSCVRLPCKDLYADESAAFQGGVSGNAGLFSTAEEVAKVYQMLLNGGELDGKRYLSKETCRVFTTTVSKMAT